MVEEAEVSNRVIEIVRPRFVVEAKAHEPDGWGFEGAFETLEEARSAAVFESRHSEHVRIVDRGESE